MSEKHINKLNVNPFLCSIILQAFYRGYEDDKCPLLLHYIVVPMILFGDIRTSLLSINKNMELNNFVSLNKINLINLQESVWFFRRITNQALIVLHNKQQIKLSSTVEILGTADYNNYSDDVKKYLRAATYLGIMFKKEPIENIFKIFKVIP